MSAANLIDLVSGVPGPKELVVGEGELAQWVKETLGGIKNAHVPPICRGISGRGRLMILQ